MVLSIVIEWLNVEPVLHDYMSLMVRLVVCDTARADVRTV